MTRSFVRAKRLILHLGHGKTGSTSIQRALRASTDVLREASVLFPDPGRHDNHQLVFPHLTGVLPDDPVQMASLAKTPKTARHNAARLWDDLRLQMAQQRPETVVLSCENQFRAFPQEALDSLSWHAAELAERCDVVAYLRSPAPFFLSNVQQDVKKRPEFRHISATRYRDVLAPFQMYGPGPVQVRRFTRADLHEQDVVQDFVDWMLPEVQAMSLSRGQAEENTTVSAEAMALLQEVFRNKLSLPGRFAKDRKAFRKLLVAMDAKVPGGHRPNLYDPVRAIVEARAGDLDWLATEFGIRFDDVTATSFSPDQAEADYLMLRDVAQICAVDETRKTELWQASLSKARRQTSVLGKITHLFRPANAPDRLS